MSKEKTKMFDVSMTKPSVRVNLSRTKFCDVRVPLPAYETEGAAGMDVRANLSLDHRKSGMTIEPGSRLLIPTGILLEIPTGYEMQVRPRSGIALKAGVTVLNSPGTIDSDYRGEIGVILINLGNGPFLVGHGDRIAQLVLAPVSRCEWSETDLPTGTLRGSEGFGSTGV
jgi:dUTP pyrophosphatase